MNRRINKAVNTFEKGYNCSQSVLSTYAKDFNIDTEAALRLAAPFGGGIARLGNTCGAVSGALMVLGLSVKIDQDNIKVSKDEAYLLALEFITKFEDHFGSTFCKELLKCDIGTPEGYKLALETGIFSAQCAEFVRVSAEIVWELIG